jgi:hypothetical protein
LAVVGAEEGGEGWGWDLGIGLKLELVGSLRVDFVVALGRMISGFVCDVASVHGWNAPSSKVPKGMHAVSLRK